MRGSDHSREFRRYTSTEAGLVLGEALPEYDAIVTGIPTRTLRPGP